MKRLVPIAALFLVAADPAIAHVGHGSAIRFAGALCLPIGAGLYAGTF
jgi:hypothetical protein